MKTYYHHKHGAIKDSKLLNLNSPKKVLLISLSVILLLIGVSYMWYKTSLQPVGKGESKPFVVAKGDSVNDILDRLKKDKLIKSSLSLKIHAKINGTYSKLKVGKYSISPELSGPQIVEIISGGKVSDAKLTILAGKTVQEILPELYQHFGQGQVQQTLDNLESDFHPILADQPKSSSINLEGYFLPETYTDLNSGVSFEDWLKRNFDLYSERISSLRDKIATRGFNLHEAFTLASIIQKESSVPEEQKKIAQVFETRLQRGISLGADPTFIYAAKLKGVEPSPTIDSPYNTRIYKGLPPTPIGTFELTALKAVADPAQTDFLYFVAGDDGTIYYNYTEEEHQADIKAYCQKLCN
ncbi:MAG: endolytic transglycosylase MltG [Candidatus Nomurabacteria bacterium]|nr:MAG: endolytic transglycosylase MltG [Candidatus Nomurabacteria bacterium]HRV76214.1 endolytic transglycosylase MltG [Candidatus Saccharimonadales bacterium]